MPHIHFAVKENIEIRFNTKPKQYLIINNPLDFNKYYITVNADNENNKSIYLRQKQQGKKLKDIVDIKIYVQQRARSIYIAIIY